MPLLIFFSGSNTTGHVAEQLGRKWLSIELDCGYAVLSAVRFMETFDDANIRAMIAKAEEGLLLKIRHYSRS